MPRTKALNKIKQRRLELGLTQKQLSQEAGISREFISKIENDHILHIGLYAAKRIAEALRQSIEELFP